MLPTSVEVVIPAQNESAEILGCLASVEVAATAAQQRFPELRLCIYVVADQCIDAPVDLVRVWQTMSSQRVELLVAHHSNVGKARALGVQRYLAAEPGTQWIALTDADTRVPPDWLVTHLEHAQTGVDCLVGTVEPRTHTALGRLLHNWFARHTLAEGHPHIFGANLGMRGWWYRAVGGFLPLPSGEDVAIVETLRARGARVVSTDTTRVATSARFTGRVADGFSTYCGAL